MVDFHRLPGTTHQIDTNLHPGEIITAIDVPNPAQDIYSPYLIKLRDRISKAFALVSVATVLELAPNGMVKDIRIALGGVAINLGELRRSSLGTTQTTRASQPPLNGNDTTAKPHQGNAFKVELAKRAIVGAVY